MFTFSTSRSILDRFFALEFQIDSKEWKMLLTTRLIPGLIVSVDGAINKD